MSGNYGPDGSNLKNVQLAGSWIFKNIETSIAFDRMHCSHERSALNFIEHVFIIQRANLYLGYAPRPWRATLEISILSKASRAISQRWNHKRPKISFKTFYPGSNFSTDRCLSGCSSWPHLGQHTPRIAPTTSGILSGCDSGIHLLDQDVNADLKWVSTAVLTDFSCPLHEVGTHEMVQNSHTTFDTKQHI